MVPLIGRLKLFNELQVYVLLSLPRIVLVRKYSPLHNVYQVVLPRFHLASNVPASHIPGCHKAAISPSFLFALV